MGTHQAKDKWWGGSAAGDSAPQGKGVTVLSAATVIEGDLVGNGVLEIHGAVYGNVEGFEVYVSPEGFVEGEIIAERLRVAGQFFGRADAHAVLVESTAEIDATIHHHEIAIEAGAKVTGLRPWRPAGQGFRMRQAG